MSSFSEMTRYGDLTSSIDSILGKYENSPDKSRAIQARSLVFLDSRGESLGLPPDAIGEPLEKKERLKTPSIPDNPGKPAKKGKSKKKSKSSKKGKFSARRGIDSLLRNAYRAQLDMLSLAAVKANIMISLNGLLISMLIISGTHIIGIEIWFAIPILLFLLSSATATIFAVLAARPDISRRKFLPDDFKKDKAHLLAFEEDVTVQFI